MCFFPRKRELLCFYSAVASTEVERYMTCRCKRGKETFSAEKKRVKFTAGKYDYRCQLHQFPSNG